jgi:hypothetical protein
MNGCMWVILIFDIFVGNSFLVLVRCVSQGNKLGILAVLIRWGWRNLQLRILYPSMKPAAKLSAPRP